MRVRRRNDSTRFWEEKKWLGKRISNFEIQSFLGRGGTAMVFKVLDHDTGLHRALKMTASEPTPSELHRFKREFRVMSRLAHPNVISVYRYGVLETRPYFMMELIEGRDLRSYLRATIEEKGFYQRVAEALAQVARALAYVHDRHIVHRDLKPGNILVTHLGVVKVMDFGIAFDEIDVTIASSRSNKLMGTLAYVSPEQATGRKVDARSDLYSIGVILYEMLAGKKPFRGTTISRMVYKHLHEVPSDPRDARPDAPALLANLALALLAKRPHDRPQSAQEVMVRLETFLTGGRVPDHAAVTSEIAPERLPLHEPAFIGREKILSAVRMRLQQMCAGKGGIALIAGDNGMGKSRFIDEVCREEAIETAYVLSGRCHAQATRSYQAFREIVRQLFMSHEESGQSPASALTPPQVALLVAAFPELKPELSTRSEGDSSRGEDEVPDWLSLFTAVRAIFERLVELGPVVLTFDDLDLADEASLSLLQALVRTLVTGGRGRRLFILGTMRLETLQAIRDPNSGRGGVLDDESRGDREDSDARAHPSGVAVVAKAGPAVGEGATGPRVPLTLMGGGVERLKAILDMTGYYQKPLVETLQPLGISSIKQMVRSMLGQAKDAEGLAEYLVQQTDGNPAIIEAILRTLVAQGMLVRRDFTTTGWEWTLRSERMDPRMASLALPVGLQGALKKRFSLLEPRDVMLLQFAAALGHPFTYEKLRVVSELEEEPLLDFFDRMLKARLLYERSDGGRMTYDFEQARAREFVMSELGRQEQVLLHQQIGRRLAAEWGEEVPADIGRHLYEGRQYDEALPYLVIAGERLVRQHLYRLALTPLAQAEEILSRYRIPHEGQDDREIKLRLDHALGMALWGIGRGEQAYEHLTLALGTVEKSERYELEAQVRTTLGHVLCERGEYRRGREHFEEAVARLREGGLSYQVGAPMLGLGRIVGLQGPLNRATSIYAEVRDLALELQRKAQLAGAILGLGQCAVQSGKLSEAFPRLDEALSIHRWLEDRPAMLEALESLATVHRIAGNYEKALGTVEDASQMAREYDLRPHRVGVCTVLGEIFLDLNALEPAGAAVSEGMTLCSLDSLVYHRANLLRVRGTLMEQKGDLAAAIDAYRQGLKLAQGISAHLLVNILLAQVARVQLRAGQVDSARRLIDKSMLELKEIGAMYACAEAALISSDIRREQGDTAAAHFLLTETITRAIDMDARDLAFRALISRLRLPVSPEGYSLNIGLQRAAGILQRLIESTGARWRRGFLEREDVATFMEAHPVALPLEDDTSNGDPPS